MYRAICIACHDVDGRGTIVRKAMPAIPDFSDAKWQASRTDAELEHSILDGKGQLMLAMKDKIALAHSDVKEMVAFVRLFPKGSPALAAAATIPAATTATSAPVVASGPAAPVAGTTTSPPAAASLPTPGLASGAPGAAPELTSPASMPSRAVAGAPPSDAAPLASASPVIAAVPAALTPGTAAAVPSSAQKAKLRVAGDFYNTNCLACHGPDGRGTVIRVAMPQIPDFTSREWHTNHDGSQLAVSILDGKGAFMPPWRGKLDPAVAQDLVAYIRTFGPADLVLATRSTGEFGTRLRQLRQQLQELDRQARALAGP
jgi:mono/diheme cytochrome c family protein